MEKEHYRQNLQMLMEQFPNRMTITPKEASQVLHADIKTVRSAMARARNPLPSVALTSKKRVIPISAFAKWICA